MVIIDAPTGMYDPPLLKESKAFTAKEWADIHLQVSTVTTSDSCVFAAYVTPRDYAMVEESMHAAGYSSTVPYYWVKESHHASNMVMYNPAVEMMCIGFKPSMSAHSWMGPESNPQDRVNWVLTRTIPSHEKVKTEGGKVLNPCEKPRSLAKLLATRHCEVGDWVLVLCAGVGGEVLGCVEAGMNVVCVEKDADQYLGLCSLLAARAGDYLREVLRRVQERQAERQAKTEAAAKKRAKRQAKMAAKKKAEEGRTNDQDASVGETTGSLTSGTSSESISAPVTSSGGTVSVASSSSTDTASAAAGSVGAVASSSSAGGSTSSGTVVTSASASAAGAGAGGKKKPLPPKVLCVTCGKLITKKSVRYCGSCSKTVHKRCMKSYSNHLDKTIWVCGDACVPTKEQMERRQVIPALFLYFLTFFCCFL